MTAIQANDRAARCKGVFPSMTDAQVLAAAEKFEHFSMSQVDKAINRLTEKQEDYSLPKILFLIREQEPRAAGQTAQRSVLETMREDAMKANPSLANQMRSLSNTEYILRRGRKAWLDNSEIGPSGNPNDERVSRWPTRARGIIHEARGFLVLDCGIGDLKIAEQLASCVVADEMTYRDALATCNGEAVPA